MCWSRFGFGRGTDYSVIVFDVSGALQLRESLFSRDRKSVIGAYSHNVSREDLGFTCTLLWLIVRLALGLAAIYHMIIMPTLGYILFGYRHVIDH